jgi:predicted metal-dependent HD superfamily phosphohydrolase
MTEIDKALVNEVSNYVIRLLQEKLPDTILFHDVNHARYVAEKAEYIGKGARLNENDLNLVVICAWFHDVGFVVDPNNHEEEGVNIAKSFLESKGVEKELIEQVGKSILSTAMPQQPFDDVSKVLCDADLAHLASEDYFDRIDKLRQEWNLIADESVGKRKFYKMSSVFFQKHEYFTDFAKKELQPGKEKNLEQLKKQVYMLEQKKEQKMLDKEKKKNKAKGYSRGVESMFRLTARNQISLSSIADNKSNILISVNAIMLSVAMTVLVTRFDELPNMIIPTLIFLVFCVVTIIFAILSTRPNISQGTFTKEDIEQNKVNLLFFGNFYNMELEEYEWAIGELMKNDQNLYGTMIKDQYFLGKVLAKKYKLLRVAYSIFMFGIIISVLAFVLAFVNI